MRALAEHALVIVFRVGNYHCAVPVTDVDSVVVPQALTHLPNQPAWARGIFKFRGHPIAVISLFHKFGLPDPSNESEGQYLTVYTNKGTVAYWVNEIYDITGDYKPHSHIPPHETEGPVFEKVLQWDDKLVLLCDVNHLFNMESAKAWDEWLDKTTGAAPAPADAPLPVAIAVETPAEEPKPVASVTTLPKRDFLDAVDNKQNVLPKAADVVALFPAKAVVTTPAPITAAREVSNTDELIQNADDVKQLEAPLFTKSDVLGTHAAIAETAKWASFYDKRLAGVVVKRESHNDLEAPSIEFAPVEAVTHIPSAILQQLDSEMVQLDTELPSSAENIVVNVETNSAFDAYLDELSDTVTQADFEPAQADAVDTSVAKISESPQSHAAKDQDESKPSVRLEDIFAPTGYGQRPRVKHLGLAGLVSIILASYGTYWITSNNFATITVEPENANVDSDENRPAQAVANEISKPELLAEPEIATTAMKIPDMAANATVESAPFVEDKPVVETKALTTIEKLHDVQKGETLWILTDKYLHDPFQYPSVASDNNIANPDLIHPNDKIRFTIKDGEK